LLEKSLSNKNDLCYDLWRGYLVGGLETVLLLCIYLWRNEILNEFLINDGYFAHDISLFFSVSFIHI